MAPLVLAILGLVLAGYATDLFLNSPTERTANYVLMPGGTGGLLLILAGAGVGRSASRPSARRRLASILKELLADGPAPPTA